MEVTILNLDHQGRGLARIDNKIIFIPKTLPGEVVDIDIVVNKKNYMEGIINKIIVKSPKRIVSDCLYFDKCGGCNLRHMSYEDELEYKENKVKDIIKRYGKFDTKIEKIEKSVRNEYRNKVVLKVDNGIGFYQEKTNKIIEIEKCLLVNNEYNKIISKLKNHNLKNVSEITIRGTDEIMVVFDNDIDDSLRKDLKDYKVIVNKEDSVIEKIGEYSYQVSPKSFFQVNRFQTVNLYNKVLEYCNLNKSEKVLDLYCGSGTIGIFISKYCSEVLGIEISESSVKDAFINKEINNVKNIDFIFGDASKKINNIDFKPDVIIVDPPRSGLEKNVIDNIIKMSPSKVVYVSCDPMTLVRDLNLLKDKYDVVSLKPFDMFPGTYHVECVVLLSRVMI